MKHYISLIILLAATVLSGGCTDDMLPGNQEPPCPGAFDEGELVEVPLQLAVNNYEEKMRPETRASVPSEQPEPESDDERYIHDIWVFQYGADGNRLILPRYYTITDQTQLNNLTQVVLQKDTPSTVYVVANVGDDKWADGTAAQDFDTLEKLRKKTLPSPFPIQAGKDDIIIPMSGQTDNVTATDNSLIVVRVVRMYAKIKVKVNLNVKDMELYNINISDIPWHCQVSTLATEVDQDGEPVAVDFPNKSEFISRAFTASDMVEDNGGKWVVIYVPENLRGENDNSPEDSKLDGDIPEKALAVEIQTKYDGSYGLYKVYPGGNDYNNFNVQRNNVYRMTVDINKFVDQHQPSSNCFIVKPGELLAFEPYNRVEKGGGFNFSDYLNPGSADKTITRVAIIWQTQDCIGDNSNGNLVYLGPETENPVNRKIYVKGGKEGNALVGAYNSNGDIIWSWHIWITPNEPDNLANAVVYTTYRWDSKGIYNKEPRIPGYAIMPCNIGALAFRSDDMSSYSVRAGVKFNKSQIRTFGMLYQWGRKDPFPPMISSTGIEDSNGTLEYTDSYTEKHYANDNRTIVHKTSSFSDNANGVKYLFYSKSGDNNGMVKYSIAHPTVYIAGTNQETSTSYFNDGDWLPRTESNDRLWGATEKDPNYRLSVPQTTAHLYNNYGEKSIFDPCPTGWRVAPGDLWLGFTSTGLNPVKYDEVNYCDAESGKRPGLSMYVTAFRSGPTVYFPLQGTRLYNGLCSNPGLCGNYHNATCDDNNRVNLLHLHRNMKIAATYWTNLMLFKLFEDTEKYYAKSTAGPIRCVRDSK